VDRRHVTARVLAAKPHAVPRRRNLQDPSGAVQFGLLGDGFGGYLGDGFGGYLTDGIPESVLQMALRDRRRAYARLFLTDLFAGRKPRKFFDLPASTPAPITPVLRDRRRLYALVWQDKKFAGRKPRTLHYLQGAALVYGKIGDGFGSYLNDGFGGYLNDGYLESSLQITFRDRRMLSIRFYRRKPYPGRSMRRVPFLQGTALVYGRIGDGFGGFLLDGYGGYLNDGYVNIGPQIGLPTDGARRRLYQAHFRHTPFKGFAKHQHVAGSTAPAVIPPIGVSQARRKSAILRNHFTPELFAGARQPAHIYGGALNLGARASQFFFEVLNYKSTPGMRASQLTAPVLVTTTAPTRASQIVAEALYKQANPPYVRASQIVLEVLVPHLEYPLPLTYPVLKGLTFDWVKRPKFSTGVGVSASGREVRVAYWARPQWEWDLSYDILGDSSQWTGTTASDLKTLMGFILAVYGSWAAFYFQDPDDYSVTGQVLGTGDGTTQQFQMVRTYGLGEYTGTEPVGSVNNSEPVNVYLNGVLQTSGYTLNTTTPCGNYINFATAPAAGVSVTADFQFFYYCRLKDDSYDFSKFMQNLWDTKKLTVFSLKN
jgi:uncharacterized protein (TIGR02217 family)